VGNPGICLLMLRDLIGISVGNPGICLLPVLRFVLMPKPSCGGWAKLRAALSGTPPASMQGGGGGLHSYILMKVDPPFPYWPVLSLSLPGLPL
jgi:hypothetical protein